MKSAWRATCLCSEWTWTYRLHTVRTGNPSIVLPFGSRSIFHVFSWGAGRAPSQLVVLAHTSASVWLTNVCVCFLFVCFFSISNALQDLWVYGSDSSRGSGTYLLPFHPCRRPGEPPAEPRGLWVTYIWIRIIYDVHPHPSLSSSIWTWQSCYKSLLKSPPVLLLEAPSAATFMNCQTINRFLFFPSLLLSAKKRPGSDWLLSLAPEERRVPVDPVHCHCVHQPQSPPRTQRYLG